MESNSNPNSIEERNWLELPADVTSRILMNLGAVDILTTAQIVCSSWRQICKDPLMWRVVDMQYSYDFCATNYDLNKVWMCMKAVDRSCGQLIDINIEQFGTDKLLHYITRCSNQLRRLRLVVCCQISNKVLSNAFSKLPLLEDFEISYSLCEVETLETLGRCCPLLKSLKVNYQFCAWMECDKAALCIAEKFPNLRHLQIFGNSVTNRGLQAILDGCPDLESLDLRHCFHLRLVGQLGKECAQRIKKLRLPHDPTDDLGLPTTHFWDVPETVLPDFGEFSDDFLDDLGLFP